MNLKGQNFRLLTLDSASGKYRVIAKSTSCSVTLTGNTEDASHKDITGMAAAPSIVSKGWSAQVESLDVTDMRALLFAVVNGVPLTVRFDETSTSNNQTELKAGFAREGVAFVNDLSLAFNDRTNATKSFQLSGTGALKTITGSEETEIVSVDTPIQKGQYFRLFLSSNGVADPSRVISAAKQLTLHISISLEESTTKDTEGDWVRQEPTGISFDISSNALMRSGETITSSVEGQTLADIETIFNNAVPVKFAIAAVSGTNNRTKGNIFCSGKVIITSLVMNGPNRANADYTTTLNGFGDLELQQSVPEIMGYSFTMPIGLGSLSEEESPKIRFNGIADANDLVSNMTIELHNSTTARIEAITPYKVSVETSNAEHMFDMTTDNGYDWRLVDFPDSATNVTIIDSITMN